MIRGTTEIAHFLSLFRDRNRPGSESRKRAREQLAAIKWHTTRAERRAAIIEIAETRMLRDSGVLPLTY